MSKLSALQLKVHQSGSAEEKAAVESAMSLVPTNLAASAGPSRPSSKDASGSSKSGKGSKGKTNDSQTVLLAAIAEATSDLKKSLERMRAGQLRVERCKVSFL